MKKQFKLMAILCAIAFTCNAQTEKGNNLIGGSVSYQSTKNNESTGSNTNRLRSFAIMPSYGHFFSKNLAVGLAAGYNKGKSEQTNTNFINGYSFVTLGINKYHQFNVGPFVRYYVDIVDKFKFFGQFNASIGFGKNEQSFGSYSPAVEILGSNSSYKYTSYNAALNPGFAFFPTKKWAVELSFPLVAYNKQDYKDIKSTNPNYYTPPSSTNSFLFGFSSFNPSIGVNYHF